MVKDGYDAPFSCAITAASANHRPDFSPEHSLRHLRHALGTSVGALFLGGMVPGIMLALVLSIYVWYISRKRDYPRGESFTFIEFIKFSMKAFPALLTPVILLVGIYTGVMTPTEAGAVAALYALIVALFAYRVLGFKALLVTLKDTVIEPGR